MHEAKLPRAGLAFRVCLGAAAHAGAQTALAVAAFHSVDKIVEAAIPAWKRRHPDVGIKAVSRRFADHHAAMTTALSTSFHLLNLRALEAGCVGRFAQGGGLEDLAREPYRIREIQAQFAPYAFKPATSHAGAVK